MAAIESLSFAWPWLALGMPLPWLLAYWRRPAADGAALRVCSLDDFVPADMPASGLLTPSLGVADVLRVLAWLLLVGAAMRPQVVDPSAPVPATGRDLMIALDTSVSMATQDMRLDDRPAARIAVARALAADFVGRRDGDRVGLIVFGSKAYLHTPLSFDLAALRSTLRDVETGLAGRETALGDAIALAARRMREFGDSARVLVLLTDGASNAGELTVDQAIWLARREGVRIFTVGLGATRMRVVVDGAIREVDPSTDLDEATLQRIASETGGFYQRAADPASLAQFYQRLDELEPTNQPARADRRPAREIYPWLLAAALLLSLGQLLSVGIRRIKP